MAGKAIAVVPSAVVTDAIRERDARAQQAREPKQYADFQKATEAAQDKLINGFILRGAQHSDSFRVIHENGTDLCFQMASLEKKNVPYDDSLASQIIGKPAPMSINGTLFSAGFKVNGARVKNIRFTFKNGAITSAIAEDGQDMLNALMTKDGGLQVLQIGFGTTAPQQCNINNPDLDGAISGNVRISLGHAGQDIADALHLVTNLHGRNGQIELDEMPIQQNGEWLKSLGRNIYEQDIAVLNSGWHAINLADTPAAWRTRMVDEVINAGTPGGWIGPL